MGKYLHVGNLNYESTKDDIAVAFGECGVVVNVTVTAGEGTAFVEYETEEAAAKAVGALNGTVLDGWAVRVNKAISRTRRRDGGTDVTKKGKRLYVGNLNFQSTEDDIAYVFERCGEVLDVTVMEGKGFAFVEYETEEAAEKAYVDMDGAWLDGRELRVDIALGRPSRGDGGGGFAGSRDRF